MFASLWPDLIIRSRESRHSSCTHTLFSPRTHRTTVKRLEYYKKLVFRLAKYSASTLLGTGVDMLVLWVFSHFILSGYVGEYLISPLISFECAVLMNFVCAYFFVWRDRVTTLSPRSFLRHYLGYNLTATGSFFVKMFFLLLLERIFKWDVLICNLAALVFSGGVNFLLNERVVFGTGKLADKLHHVKPFAKHDDVVQDAFGVVSEDLIKEDVVLPVDDSVKDEEMNED